MTKKKIQPPRLAFLLTRLGFAVAVIVLVVSQGPFFVLKYTGNVAPTILVIVISIALALLLGTFMGYLEAKQFARPLEELESRTQKYVAGDYSIEFAQQNGTRETIAIASSLDSITQSSRTALAELRLEEQRQRQFVSDVSHEIRTPLTGIRGNAETLLEGDVPLEDQQRFLGTIISECDRLTRLANDLLTLQRIEATAKEIALARINLRALVEKVVDMLEPLLDAREVALSISGEAPDVLGDADKLTQVLVNLVENGSRFAQGNMHIELSGLKGQSVITVSDDGPGFGNVDPARLFDRFYRADPSRQSATGGAGLGLAIVKTIVTAHDGTVEAFNIPSGGACFLVAIPSVAPL